MRRPLHAATCAGAVAHHSFELAAGVGLVFQPFLGLTRAAALWGIGLPGWFAVAAKGAERWDRALAFLAGLSLGGAVVHYTLWPVERRHGLPVLTQAEGLRPKHLPAYNALLYTWGALALSALAVESPKPARRWALAGLLASLPLRASARHHFTWIRDQAVENPAWWNRAFEPEG